MTNLDDTNSVDLVLVGKIEFDADNNPYLNSDTYGPDGTLIKRYRACPITWNFTNVGLAKTN